MVSPEFPPDRQEKDGGNPVVMTLISFHVGVLGSVKISDYG